MGSNSTFDEISRAVNQREKYPEALYPNLRVSILNSTDILKLYGNEPKILVISQAHTIEYFRYLWAYCIKNSKGPWIVFTTKSGICKAMRALKAKRTDMVELEYKHNEQPVYVFSTSTTLKCHPSDSAQKEPSTPLGGITNQEELTNNSSSSTTPILSRVCASYPGQRVWANV